jgi:phospholipid/cholesterol/gamma-HCH transport system substrate-binding protein
VSGATDRRALGWLATKSLVFTLATVLATAILAITIRNSDGGETSTYTAVFTDATSVNRGDDVRMAGVKVGTVQSIGVTDKRLAEVEFTVRDDVELATGTVVQLRFRNLVGQRYVALIPPPVTGADPGGGAGSSVPAGAPAVGDTISPGHRFGPEETRPALDLTLLFDGFRPLLRLLDPEDVNQLSAQIIAVFQGEGATVEGLLESTASLTTTLAEKDQVIGELISSLSTVLTTVNDRSTQLDTTLVTMQQLVSGLAQDRESIGTAITGMADLTTSVADLLGDTRPALRRSIQHLDTLSGTLDDHSGEVETFLERLPTKLDRIGRLVSYGSWLNTYLCSMEGRIPMPQGYTGDLGAQPIAGRCR